VPLGIAASLSLTSSGLVLQTQGFKHGSALVVCTTAAAASIVAGERGEGLGRRRLEIEIWREGVLHARNVQAQGGGVGFCREGDREDGLEGFGGGVVGSSGVGGLWQDVSQQPGYKCFTSKA